MVVPGATYLITRRTLRRHHLLAPDPRMRRIFLYCLAVAAARTGVQVHVVTLLSTHEHLEVTDPRGRLPEFLQYLHRHVALATKILRKWEGPLWDHESTSTVELRTPYAVVEKAAYCMANPVAAGLVPRANDWPGVNTRPSELGRACWRIERPTEYFSDDDGQWPPVVELRLTMPPAAAELGVSDDRFREMVAEELEALEATARAKVKESGRSFLGADRCAKLSPFRRARSSEDLRSLSPTFAVGRGQRAMLLDSVARLRAFRAAYRQAFTTWATGDRAVPFPAGTWLMHHVHGAVVDRPTAAAA
jgi:putative transposase